MINMTSVSTEIRKGAYYDSVVLMQLQRALLTLPGVVDAGVVMATPANKDLLAQSNLLTDAASPALPDDLLIVVSAADNASAGSALGQVDALLARRRSSDVGQDFRPRSLESAAAQLPDARWAMISVPGRYAAGVARQALDLGKHVFLYSDNVSVEDEVALKNTARERGLLVMGPDCGTAIVHGIGMGFANRVRREPISGAKAIGIVAASGTGLQAVASRVHALGGAISHALGTGGRDLKAEVGAVTASQALDLLARDPATGVIVLISKPPAPAVATRLLAQALACGKPVVVDFIGQPVPGRALGNLHFATSLDDAGELARALAISPGETVSIARRPGYLRGLFSGGTLAYEAVLVLQSLLHPLHSNAAISADQHLTDPLKSQGHTILDLGGDEFTVGRLHPMMDNDLRIRRLKQEAADPQTGLILIDVVLGEGAHADPANELAPAIAAVRQARPDLAVWVVLVGTDSDPQGFDRQREQFATAGAVTFDRLSDALSDIALAFAAEPVATGLPVALDVLESPIAINIGVESFYDSLKAQGASAVQVDWRPPASGNEKLAGILARMKRK